MMHLLQFFAVLGQMRLQVGVEPRRYFRRAAHQFFRAGDGKTRAEGVFEASILRAMPFPAEPFALKQ